MTEFRIETDSLGEVQVPVEKLWGAQTQRAILHFGIGTERLPSELIAAYAFLKKAAAMTNRDGGHLSSEHAELIIHVCDELLEGKHEAEFPLHVWMTGSGTQFNMNINEVISNRVCQLVGTALGSKSPVHPNDHVNMSQSSNDTFPSAMSIAAALATSDELLPSVRQLRDSLDAKVRDWSEIVKIGRQQFSLWA